MLASVGHTMINLLDKTWKISAALMKVFENLSFFSTGTMDSDSSYN